MSTDTINTGRHPLPPHDGQEHASPSHTDRNTHRYTIAPPCEDPATEEKLRALAQSLANPPRNTIAYKPKHGRPDAEEEYKQRKYQFESRAYDGGDIITTYITNIRLEEAPGMNVLRRAILKDFSDSNLGDPYQLSKALSITTRNFRQDGSVVTVFCAVFRESPGEVLLKRLPKRIVEKKI